MERTGPLFWGLVALGLTAAVVHGLVFLKRPPSFLRALVKTAFMAALTAAFVIKGSHPIMIIALGAAALGDFFLAFDKKWTQPLGILAFLITQLGYLAIFFFTWMFADDSAPLWPRYIFMALVVLTTLAFIVWFWNDAAFRVKPIGGAAGVLAALMLGLSVPVYLFVALTLMNVGEDDPGPPFAVPTWTVAAFPLLCLGIMIWQRRLGGLKLAAMIYASLITLMALAGMWAPWAAWPAMLGVALFMVSDLVLAAEMFKLPADAPIRKFTAPIVWWTYAAAQALIILGIQLIPRGN